MKNYKEIINNLKLREVEFGSVEEKEDHDVITIYGGFNGYGEILYYLRQIDCIIYELLGYYKDVWLVDWVNDCPDDLWCLRLGISHTKKKF